MRALIILRGWRFEWGSALSRRAAETWPARFSSPRNKVSKRNEIIEKVVPESGWVRGSTRVWLGFITKYREESDGMEWNNVSVKRWIFLLWGSAFRRETYRSEAIGTFPGHLSPLALSGAVWHRLARASYSAP